MAGRFRDGSAPAGEMGKPAAMGRRQGGRRWRGGGAGEERKAAIGELVEGGGGELNPSELNGERSGSSVRDDGKLGFFLDHLAVAFPP